MAINEAEHTIPSELTGWHRHKTIWFGGRYIAHGEKFYGGRPIPEGERVGTIRTAEGATPEEAEAVLDGKLK